MALSWSGKKKLFYFSLVFTVFAILILILIWPYINRQPNCFDRKQNGDETGIDCGGSCLLVCKAEAYQLVTLWARAFPVTDGTYNLMAYIENQNRDSGIAKINYEFRVYDENNIFIARKEGSSFISSNDRTAIFEPQILTDNRVPYRVDFNFTSPPVWVRVSREQKNALSLTSQNMLLSNSSTSPKLEAEIMNNSFNDFRFLDTYVVLYDENDNVINVSKTLIENLPRKTKTKVYFTWPKPFGKEPARIDVFPQVNIFEIK